MRHKFYETNGLSLREKQHIFLLMVADLIQFANSRGYQLSAGDAYRSPNVKYGHPNSLHRKRLAMDFNLFEKVNGSWKYMTKTESHLPLGEFWESIGGSWGGRFKKKDGNHYSLVHDGMK